MSVFLLTDCMINRRAQDISAFPHGNFDDLTGYLLKELNGELLQMKRAGLQSKPALFASGAPQRKTEVKK